MLIEVVGTFLLLYLFWVLCFGGFVASILPVSIQAVPKIRLWHYSTTLNIPSKFYLNKVVYSYSYNAKHLT